MLNTKGQKICPACNIEIIQYNNEFCFTCINKYDGTLAAVETLGQIWNKLDSLTYFFYYQSTKCQELEQATRLIYEAQKKLKESVGYKVEYNSKYL